MPAVLAAGIGAAGSLASGALQAGAAGSAAKDAQQAAAQSLAFTKQVYGDTTKNVQPTINYGNAAGGELAGLLNTGGNPQAATNAFNNYLNSTNYKFQLGQGENALEYANAPAFSSGATAKALNNYAQGQASGALQGYEGLLQGQQSLGTQAAIGLGGIGTQTSQNVAGINAYGANAAGNAALVQGNAYGNALSGLGSAISQGLSQSSFGGPSFGSSAFNAANLPQDNPALSGLNLVSTP